MSVKIFYGADLLEKKHIPAVKHVIQAFKEYKETNNPGTMFGRDAITYRPRSAFEEDIHHVHLLNKQEFKLRPSINLLIVLF